MKLTDLQAKLKEWGVGLSNKKAEYIKGLAKVSNADWDGDIPNDIDKILAIKGIGPKIAHLFMNTVYNEITGIAVDVHVHRITNKLNFVHTNSPEQTRVALEKILDKKYWKDQISK
eukprot:CAMPEP_0116892932 /NCGR_PEP_ID=MMETSP0467-20121206/3040_1 /TAXON_ID=283647 /ORGANISM="Mesodinium pulex, Strain SPMC105" /LENGTH=115 /DNA_ID=CAMNT_0004562325 /DNA_START=434 /DNA_END=781 /DNA_ORIENTATION=-